MIHSTQNYPLLPTCATQHPPALYFSLKYFSDLCNFLLLLPLLSQLPKPLLSSWGHSCPFQYSSVFPDTLLLSPAFFCLLLCPYTFLSFLIPSSAYFCSLQHTFTLPRTHPLHYRARVTSLTLSCSYVFFNIQIPFFFLSLNTILPMSLLCPFQNFTEFPRCFSKEASGFDVFEEHCKSFIVDPPQSSENVEDEDLSTGIDDDIIIQIKPQKVKMELRVRKCYSVENS